jgi:hypothetical protein
LYFSGGLRSTQFPLFQIRGEKVLNQRDDTVPASHLFTILTLFTVKKDGIKDIFPVVQNLGVLYQGKKLSREEEECQHLLSSKEKIHC